MYVLVIVFVSAMMDLRSRGGHQVHYWPVYGSVENCNR